MPIKYPNIPRVDFREDYFGNIVEDPYRYMEDPENEDTIRFVNENNKIVDEYLNNDFLEHYKVSLEKIMNYTKLTVPIKRGSSYFYAKSVGDKNQLVIFQRQETGSENQVFDLNTLSDDGTTGSMAQYYSYDGKLMAMFVTEQGSDWQYIQIMEIETGILKEKLIWVDRSDIAWLADNSGFYYGKFPDQTGLTPEEQRRDIKIYFHKIGTSQDEDIVIYDPGNKEYSPAISAYGNGEHFFITIFKSTMPENKLFYLQNEDPLKPVITPVIDSFDGDLYIVLDVIGTKVFVYSSSEAPNNKVLQFDLNSPERTTWETIIEERQYPLKNTAIAKNKIICVYERDVKHEIEIHNLDGSLDHIVELPTVGALNPGPSENPSIWSSSTSSEFLFGFTNFFTPTTIYSYDLENQKLSEFVTPEIALDIKNYEVNQVFYPSKDGTKIPMYVIHKQGIELNGKNPTVLYGYGGYNISILPQFYPQFVSWVSDGYVFAVANLRGGGEYGKKWHEQAILGNKQNVFDDFIAAAEWLIENKYTSPSHLGINGRSNGGLLVGATLIQRPDLFGGAIPIVGVLDMLRYPFQMDAGRYWTEEYGNGKENEDHFNFLIKFSPYHNVKSGVSYPPTLVTAAEGDDRVAPMHSKKFGASLQHAQIGENPILVRIERKAGHGYGKPKSKLIEDHATHLAFFKQVLDA